MNRKYVRRCICESLSTSHWTLVYTKSIKKKKLVPSKNIRLYVTASFVSLIPGRQLPRALIPDFVDHWKSFRLLHFRNAGIAGIKSGMKKKKWTEENEKKKKCFEANYERMLTAILLSLYRIQYSGWCAGCGVLFRLEYNCGILSPRVCTNSEK